jgi:hypothetical protein
MSKLLTFILSNLTPLIPLSDFLFSGVFKRGASPSSSLKGGGREKIKLSWGWGDK